MFFTVANHNKAKNPNGFVNYEVEFDDIQDMTTSNCAYCACKLKDEYRLDDNFDGNVDVLVIDIDEVCDIDQAKQLFSKYEFYLITTKSHQQPKNGEVCDRFRLFFRLDKTVHIREHIELIYSQFIDKFGFVDASCRNVSRYFFSSPKDAIVFYNKGKSYSTQVIIKEGGEVMEPEVKKEPVMQNQEFKLINWLGQQRKVLLKDSEPESSGDLDEEAHLKGIQAYLDAEYVAGNRANCLFQASIMMHRDNFDTDYVCDYLLGEFQKRGGDKMSVALQQIKNGAKYG